MRIIDCSSDVCSSDLLVYRQAIPGEMQRVLTIIAWLLVRCSLSSMPSAAVEQRRSEPFLDRTTVSAIDIILELEGAAQHRLAPLGHRRPDRPRSEEHTSELRSLMRISYAVFCLKKKKT